MPPRRLSGGFTLIDAVTVATIIAVVVALVYTIKGGPRRHSHAEQIQCMNHVRNLVGLLEVVGPDYPRRGGPAVILSLVVRGELRGVDRLSILFCPGDLIESFDAAGGEDAYRGLDTAQSDGLDALTSYAGRALTETRCQVSRVAGLTVPLVADDSDDHHLNGFVVGYTGGAARWRDTRDHWNLDPSRRVEVGPGSAVPELECLRKR